MNALHPKNWSLACWAIFLIWIALAIEGNTIFSSTIPTDDTLQSVAAYGGLGVGREIGWPFAYGWIIYAYQTPEVWEFWPSHLFANLLLICVVQLSILAVFQHPGIRFSLRVLLATISLLSMSIAIGYTWLEFDLYWLWPAMFYVYFAPTIAIIAGIPMLIAKRMNDAE